MPISDKANETNQLYFWFFPSENEDAGDEITIWLNGVSGVNILFGLVLTKTRVLAALLSRASSKKTVLFPGSMELLSPSITPGTGPT